MNPPRNHPRQPPPPEQHQDESTAHSIPLCSTQDSGISGTDKYGKKKKMVYNPFKSISSKFKGEAEKNLPAERQELHEEEGTKAEKKQSQSVLKYYPTTKKQESSTSVKVEFELPKKSSEEWQAQVEKLKHEKTIAEEKIKDGEEKCKVVEGKLKESVEKCQDYCKRYDEKQKYCEEVIQEIISIEKEFAFLGEAITTMRKNVSERDAEIKTLQEKLAQVQHNKEANQEDLLLHANQDKIVKSEMDQNYGVRKNGHKMVN